MATNMGRAVGFLDLDISNFKKGFQDAGKQAEDAFKKIRENVGSMGETFQNVGGKMSDLGETMTKGITLPVVAAVTASMKQFANYEQAIGGIETMFKDTASSVIGNSETAYKRAGVSGVNYMEQLTSFSASLLQGLDGDTVKASKLADTAMVDMSDNANKFGTNIGSVQDAYQGFAKDNFTMLDNLKLGYGGTAGEMARLINDSGVLGDTMEVTAETLNEVSFATMIEAIHEIQNEMGVTGTTAKEAEETLSGSFGMMKASVEDFLAGMGSADADVEQLIANMVESFGYLKENVTRVLKQIWDNLPLTKFQKWAGLIAVATGPILFALGKIVTGVGKVFSAFVTTEGVLTPFGSMMKGLVSGPFLAVVAGIAVLVAAFMDLWKNNEDFRNKITDIWLNIKTSFEDFVYQITEKINALGFNFENFGEVLKAIWDKITEFLAPVFIYAFETLETIIDTALETILDVFDLFVAIFQGDWETAWNKVVDIVGNILNGLESIFTNAMDLIYSALETGWNFIYDLWETVLSSIMDPTSESFETILYNIQMAMESIWIVIDTVWNYIKESFQNAIDFVKAIFDGDWKAAWQIMKDQFELMKETVKEVWKQIKVIFANVVEIIKIKLKEQWEKIKQYFADLWVDIKVKAQEKWDEFKNYLAETWGSIVLSIKEWWDGVKLYFSELWEGIKTTFSEALDAIVLWFEELPERIGTWLTEVWNKITLWAEDMWAKATETGETFVNNITIFFEELPEKIGFVIGYVLTSIGLWVVDMATKAYETGERFVENIITFFKELPQKIADFTTKVWENIKTWATDLGNKAEETGTTFVENITDWFKKLPGRIKEKLTEVWDTVKTWAKDMWTKATETGTEFFTRIANWFDKLPGRIKAKLDQAWNDVKTWAINLWTKATEAGERLVNNVTNAIRDLPGKMKAKLNEVINNARTWVTDMGTKGREAINELWNKFKARFNAIKSNFKTIGTDIVSGVWNGIQSKITSFTNNVKSFFGGIVSGAKAALGIKSPSTVMAEEIGDPMAEGAEVGFIGKFRSVLGNIQKSITKGVDGLETKSVEVGVEGTTENLGKTIDFNVEQMFIGILDIFYTIEDRIAESISRTVENLRGMLLYSSLGYSDLAYASSSQSIPISTRGFVSTNGPSNSEIGLRELKQSINDLEETIEEIKDISIETVVNLDNREIARAQRDPLDEEFGRKARDKNQGKGRTD